jgi:hypothetical protein
MRQSFHYFEENHMSKKTVSRITAEDIDWNAVEQGILSGSANAKSIRKRFGKGVTPQTFKKWATAVLGVRYTVDWGGPGRFNVVRLLPKQTKVKASNSVPVEAVAKVGGGVSDGVNLLVKNHGLASVLFAIAQVAAHRK